MTMQPTQGKISGSGTRAFTLVELGVVLSVLLLLLAMLLPAFARNQNQWTTLRCRNNLKQLTAVWKMYSADNSGKLVSAYSSVNGFRSSWVLGNAASSGSAGSYGYGGADPAGITNGLLWPYVGDFNLYRCYGDNRVASQGLAQYYGKPILRSISMNSYLAGTSYGISPIYSPVYSPTTSSSRNPSIPVLLTQTEISRHASIMVFLEEDPASINDSMFLVDMSGSNRMLDLPTRVHANIYGISFADGHVDGIKLQDPFSISWTPAANIQNTDLMRLTNYVTNPL